VCIQCQDFSSPLGLFFVLQCGDFDC